MVIETEKVMIGCRFKHHRPEDSELGVKVIRSMCKAWQSGKRRQPWLSVWDRECTVADDYFWIALIEKGKPKTVATQVLNEPLDHEPVEKVGPLETETIKKMLGFVDAS